MKLSDFSFTVGYHGAEAIINKATEGQGKGLSVTELADNGLFKPALCTALYNNDHDGIQYIINTYNRLSGSAYHSEAQIKRLFGVFSVPGNVTKTKRL